MADSTLWAVVVGGGIGLASSIATGLVGGKYTLGAAREQAKAALDQSELEHKRRDHEHRQGVYHSFTNAVSKLNATAAMAQAHDFQSLAFNPDSTGELRERFLTLLTEVRDHMNGILLFGTESVTATAIPVDRLLLQAERKVQLSALLGAAALTGDTGFTDALNAWESAVVTPEWQAAMEALRQAMRDEVAAG